MKKIICKNCGVINEISDDAQIEDSDWVECTLPEGFEWVLPAGKITPVIGDPLYISAQGEHLSQPLSICCHGCCRQEKRSRGNQLKGQIR